MTPQKLEPNAGNSLRTALLCALELFCFLGVVPLLAVAVPEFMPRRLLLFIGCFYAVARLWGRVERRRLLARPSIVLVRGAVLRGLVVAGLILVYVLLWDREHLFDFPSRKPGLWLLVFFLYPVLSALPQEIIYRVYVFEAFGPLRRRPWVALWVSGLAFGWVHVIYAGWFAVAASIPIGLILAWVYKTRRDEPGVLIALVLEHSLYGLAVFTLGVGRYFYLAR